jgi:hypothetical protein
MFTKSSSGINLDFLTSSLKGIIFASAYIFLGRILKGNYARHSFCYELFGSLFYAPSTGHMTPNHNDIGHNDTHYSNEKT